MPNTKTFGGYWRGLDITGKVRFVMISLLMVVVVALELQVSSLKGSVKDLNTHINKVEAGIHTNNGLLIKNTLAIETGKATREAEHQAMTVLICKFANELYVIDIPECAAPGE